MSTKTTFKRIALVAAASLGLGVLSVVPAQATTSAVTLTVADGTAGLAGVKTDSTNAATFTVAGLFDTTSDSLTVSAALVSIPTGATPVIGIQYLDSNTPSTTTIRRDTVAAAGGYSSTAYSATVNKVSVLDTALSGVVRLTTSATSAVNFSENFGLQLDSATSTRVAGTYTYTIYVKYTSDGVVNTLSKNVNIVIAAAASSSATPSAVTSFVNLNSAAAASQASAGTDSVINGVATAGTAAGYIWVGNRNASNGTSTAKDSLTVTVTGAGVVCTTSSLSATPTAGTCGKVLSKVAATGDYQFIVQGDGTSGSSSITVTAGIAGWSFTKNLSFYAKAAKTLTATVLTPVLGIGSNDSAIAVTGVDDKGTVWSGTPYIYASTAADATAVGGSSTTPVACVVNSAGTTAYCPITATAAGTGKFKVIDASTIALATATSNEVTVTSKAGVASSVKIAFDKASYAPGEKAVITVTPLDAAGAKLAAGTFTNILAAGITASNGFTSGSGGTTNDTLAGVNSVTTSAYTGTDLVAGTKTYVVYMPLASGTVTLTAKGGALLPAAGQVALTASATVASDGAAALAAVTALASQVSAFITKINAQITTLTDLVMKIQKKVKA